MQYIFFTFLFISNSLNKCIPRNPVTPVSNIFSKLNGLTLFNIFASFIFSKLGIIFAFTFLSIKSAKSFIHGLLYISCIEMLYFFNSVYTLFKSNESIPKSSIKSSVIDIVRKSTNFFIILYISFSVFVSGNFILCFVSSK